MASLLLIASISCWTTRPMTDAFTKADAFIERSIAEYSTSPYMR
jgi:hypothetical protein